MRLYIIRHADPDYPNNTITAFGHIEAQALARRLDKQGLNRIYSSPVPRALVTAQYTSDLLKLPVHLEKWTAELGWQMEYEDRGRISAWDIPGEVIRGGETLPTHDTWHELPPLQQMQLREQFEDIKQSSDEFLERHGYRREGGCYRIVSPNRERIAVFCHHGLGIAWLAHLLEIPLTLMWSGFWMPPSSVTTILFDERSADYATPRCIGMGDVSHMYAEDVPIQPRGIIANFD